MNQEQWRSFKLSVNIITEKKASNERLSENGKTAYNNIKQWESSKTLQQITKDNSSAHILWFFCYFYYSIACCCHFYWFFFSLDINRCCCCCYWLFYISFYIFSIWSWCVRCVGSYSVRALHNLIKERERQESIGYVHIRYEHCLYLRWSCMYEFALEKIFRSLVYFIVIAYSFATRCL